jgi:hypothetical protein
MLLRYRQGDRVYEIRLPATGRVQRTKAGGIVFVIGGERPEDTCTILPTPKILKAAREGLHGLRLVGESCAAS